MASDIDVLIPLNSGLVFTLCRFTRYTDAVGLNPFEFRAGIYLTTMTKTYEITVLIPLNSGLVFTFRTAYSAHLIRVLIPLNSGLVFT